MFFGATNQAGEDNRNVARMGLLLAGLPVSVPGVTVNRLCASGLEAVSQAARAITAGEGDLLLAGGVESMSRAPMVGLKPERGFPRGGMQLEDTTIGWRLVNPLMRELHGTDSMGETAENVAERHDVSREDQDAFALESHRRAIAAQEAGRFDDELVTVDAPQPKGDPVTVHADEGPRPDTTAERLAALRPVFREGGTVTAGNSSQINDGAACLTLASDEKAEQLGAEPLARVVATGAAGVEPSYMGVAPVPASRLALERAGLKVEDIDLMELNEAFAAQVLASIRELGVPHEKLNVNGGAIAHRPPPRRLGRAPDRHARTRATPQRQALRRSHDVHRGRSGARDRDREPRPLSGAPSCRSCRRGRSRRGSTCRCPCCRRRSCRGSPCRCPRSARSCRSCRRASVSPRVDLPVSWPPCRSSRRSPGRCRCRSPCRSRVRSSSESSWPVSPAVSSLPVAVSFVPVSPVGLSPVGLSVAGSSSRVGSSPVGSSSSPGPSASPSDSDLLSTACGASAAKELEAQISGMASINAVMAAMTPSLRGSESCPSSSRSAVGGECPEDVRRAA